VRVAATGRQQAHARARRDLTLTGP
jgi:hypothetical protein